MVTSDGENVEVQSPITPIPLSGMTIGALEVDTGGLPLRRDIPTPTSLVGDQGEIVVVSDLLDELSISLDGSQSIGD
jgi:hypothetical protein